MNEEGCNSSSGKQAEIMTPRQSDHGLNRATLHVFLGEQSPREAP